MILPFEGETRILIQPGHTFGVVDALLTNFTSLVRRFLALVAAFAVASGFCSLRRGRGAVLPLLLELVTPCGFRPEQESVMSATTFGWIKAGEDGDARAGVLSNAFAETSRPPRSCRRYARRRQDAHAG